MKNRKENSTPSQHNTTAQFYKLKLSLTVLFGENILGGSTHPMFYFPSLHIHVN